MKTLSQKLAGWMGDHFEISRGQKAAILSMEGLRGLAVVLVFFAHYAVLIQPWIAVGSVTHQIGDQLRSIGHAGVDLFFVLSGYLIYRAMIRRQRPLGDFLGKRILRIYPTFLFVFVLYLGLSLLFPTQSKIPMGQEAGALYLLQNLLFLPGMVSIEPFIVVAWSLSYEFFYYLTIPIFIAALGLRSWAPKKRLLLFGGIALVGFAYYFFNHGHIRLLMFVSGIILCEIQSQKLFRAKQGSGLIALGIAVAVMIAVKELGMGGWLRYATLFACFAWLCLDCFNSKGLTARVFSFTPLRWFGNISYSYYLIHGLTLKASFLVLAKIHAPSGTESHLFWTLLLPVFAATVVVSAGLYLLVEKPLSLASSTPRPQETGSFELPFEAVLRPIGRSLMASSLRYASAWVGIIALIIGKADLLKWLRQLLAILVPLGMGMTAWVMIFL
jgi:exopolysaccharide production protein ExoZ